MGRYLVIVTVEGVQADSEEEAVDAVMESIKPTEARWHAEAEEIDMGKLIPLTGPDDIPPEIENLYDPDEVFHFDCTPEELADAVLRTRD